MLKSIPVMHRTLSVSETGDVFNEKGHKLMQYINRLSKKKGGKPTYFKIFLWTNINGKPKLKAFYVHKLVMLAFVGERPVGLDINHKDGNKLNNALSNLEYCTKSENEQHAHRTGLKKARFWPGNRRRYTAEQRNLVFSLRGKVTIREAVRLTGMSQSHVFRHWHNIVAW